MTLEEYRHRQATEAATEDQRGAIMREFDRLGFGEEDRGTRLGACARIAGLDALESTRDLRLGDAGLILGTLLRCRHRGDLPGPVAPRPRTDWPAVLAVALYRAGTVQVAAP